MRALLALPLIALAASIAVGAPHNRSDQALLNDLEAAVEEAANALAAEMANSTEADMYASTSPTPAWLSEGSWMLAGDRSDGSIWYVNPAELDSSGPLLRVPVRSDDSAMAGGVPTSTARLVEIDCAKGRYRILNTIRYDTTGAASEANERGDGRLAPIDPAGIYQAVRLTACSLVEGAEPAFMNGM